MSSCKSKREASAKDVKAEVKQMEEKEELVTQEPLSYPLVVSFYSPGDGINHEAHKAFLSLVEEMETPVELGKTTWGREGEVDYCMPLTELADAAKSMFIQEVDNLLAGKEKVRILKNSPCINRR